MFESSEFAINLHFHLNHLKNFHYRCPNFNELMRWGVGRKNILRYACENLCLSVVYSAKINLFVFNSPFCLCLIYTIFAARNKRREVYDCFARRPDDFVLVY